MPEFRPVGLGWSTQTGDRYPVVSVWKDPPATVCPVSEESREYTSTVGRVGKPCGSLSGCNPFSLSAVPPPRFSPSKASKMVVHYLKHCRTNFIEESVQKKEQIRRDPFE